MSEYRRICAYCCTDLGPAGPEYTGNTHGLCPFCKGILLGGTLDLAKSQGAVWANFRTRSFYRPGPACLEIAVVDPAGRLGPWQRDWRDYPPEGAIRV